MATKITIGNRTTAIPGVYSQIKSGIVNPSQNLNFGNVVIIDNGSFGSSNYIASNGVMGENKNGIDAIKEFTDIYQTQSVVWDSELLTVLKSLFIPSKKRGIAGANKVSYLQASETTKAVTDFVFSKGVLSLKTIPEGESVNGGLTTKTYTQSSSTPQLATPVVSTIGGYQQYGNLPAGTYYYKVTALNEHGETVGSTEVSFVITSATGYIYLYWSAVPGATSYKVYRGTAAGAQTKYFVTNDTSFSDTDSFTGTNGTVPTTNTTGDAAGTIIPTSKELSKGLGVKLEQGRAFGYSLVFYRGAHDRMEDPLNPGYGFNEQLLPSIYQGVPTGTYNIVKPVVLFRSPDVKRLSELKRWMEKSPDFKNWFGITSFSFNDLDDAIVASDITNNQSALSPYKVFSGGQTDFSSQAFTKALQATKNLDNTFYLCLGSGEDATGTENTAIVQLIASGELKYDKYAIIGGFTDASNFLGDTDTTQAVARYFNTEKAIVTHGLAKVTNSIYPDGYRNISVLEKTAKVLGRIAGLPPQTPITFKDIAVDAEVHKLEEDEIEAGIEAGILMTAYDQELQNICVVAGINTLGNNDFLINEDASSYDITIERIKAQINKEIVYNCKRAFFGQEQGPNRNTVSDADLLTWTTTFLQSKVATNEVDNLIISFGNIVIRRDQDNIFVDYEFVPNGPINKIVFTGVMVNG